MNRTPQSDIQFEETSPTPYRGVRFMGLRVIAHLYRLRVRERPVQELLATLGIAAGVALLFAVQASTANIAQSVGTTTDTIAGDASIEVAARGSDGMPQRLLESVERQPHVKASAPLVIDHIAVIGNDQERNLTLVGADRRLRAINSPLIKRLLREQDGLEMTGLVLTKNTTQAINARPGDSVTVAVGSSITSLILDRTIGTKESRQLAQSPVAFVPLGRAQQLTGKRGRLNRILVVPTPGASNAAMHELRVIARDKFDVRSTHTESRLLADAMKADAQSSTIFSLVAIAIGLLFAFNAMMLSLPVRRRIAFQLRTLGAGRRIIVASLLFDAIVLGVVASCVGLALGEFLARSTFDGVPVYLAVGFPIGSGPTIDFSAIAVSVAGGLAAAMVASVKPAYDVLVAHSRDPGVSEGHRLIGAITGTRSLLLGLTIIAVDGVILAFRATALPFVIPTLVASLSLVTGSCIMKSLSMLGRATSVRGRVEPSLAVNELIASGARTVAIGVIAAATVMAMVAIGGARQDLERGVRELNSDVYAEHDLWITTGGISSTFLTSQFNSTEPVHRLKESPAVRSVEVNRGSFLDFRGRRVRVYASSPGTVHPLVASQVIDGDFESASRRLRSGGWITLSRSIADDLKVKPSDAVEIPTPSGPRSFRLAAITNNYGWPSGTMVLNGDDYKSAWGGEYTNVLGIDLRPGFNPNTAAVALRHALGEFPSLKVQTANEMSESRRKVSEQGTARIRQISVLVLCASVLAIVAAMLAAIWMRRTRLAVLRATGLYRHELCGTLLIETVLIVAFGGAFGLAFGFVLQNLASSWTEFSSGYDTVYEPAIRLGIMSWGLVILLAAITTLGPAYLATRVSPGVQGEG